MSTTRINFNNVILASSSANSAKSSLVTARKNILNINNSIDGLIKQRANIGNRIIKISDDINYIAGMTADVVSVCNNGANTYKNVDFKVLRTLNNF